MATLADFGATPGTDASAALTAALTYAIANSEIIDGTGEHYLLLTPVNVTVGSIVAAPFGFVGKGDQFTCNFTGGNVGLPAIQITANALNRYFNLSNFFIYSSRTSGGIKLISSLNVGNSFYLGRFFNLSIENVVGAGLHLHGDIFNCTIFAPAITDCSGTALKFENHASGGICSSISVFGAQCQQNNIGIELANNTTDVSVLGGYIHDNQQEGALFSNGCDKPWTGVGFENNWKSVAPGASATAAHINCTNKGTFVGCTFHDATGGAKWAINFPFNSGDSFVQNCQRTSAGAAAAASPGGVYIGGGTSNGAGTRITISGSRGLTLGGDGTYAGQIFYEAAKYPTVTNQTANFTFALSDDDQYVRINKTTAVVATVPPNSTVPYRVGTNLMLRQIGVGQVTVAAGAGVTINTADTLKLRTRGSTALLTKVGTNEWDFAGDLEPLTGVGGGGSTTLLGLIDAPDSYLGQANKYLQVKPDELGIDFVAIVGGGGGAANPTVMDFGAVGNGSTNDAGAFNAALAYSITNNVMIDVPSKHYMINSTIGATLIAPIGSKWGFRGLGATLVSGITNGTDLISITSNSVVRYLELSGMSLQGNGAGTDGNGIRLKADTGSVYLWNCSLLHLSCENFRGTGKAGLLIEGDVFESLILDSYFQDNYIGAKFANTANGGICSAWTILACNFSQNIVNGLLSIGPNNFDAPTDFRIYGGYCRNNGQYGMYFWNGLSPGCALDQVGYENNYQDLNVGDANGAHVLMNTRGTMRNCTGHVLNEGSTYLLKGFCVDRILLMNCSMSDTGAAAGLSRLCHVEGSGQTFAFWHMIDCTGGFDSAGNANWRADYCNAPQSPQGALNMRNTYFG